ncbi:non-canonical purine NTP pyrophosphatase [Neptunitalea chrysea]|uniref:dITP/XTP pyrophosphatase n=1 Tax=Neptunitalea chrysea TaxID=1647581 RepID=A0A9W6B746_9FLAO|nr:non-canonical purine NTP diphosphatase [Neptunitalea chrysea]GLB53756.1 non-canonical purine NTP pyrophosphatase [Neptunitalea chrysea]
MKIVFATHNENKAIEIRAMLPETIEILTLNDIGCTEEIPETEDTIEGNAILKANYVKNNYGYNCFADDTGLEVDALNGAPGVYSARYASEAKDANANIKKLLQEMATATNRKANFKTVIALNLGNSTLTFEGIVNGVITTEKHGNQGFGYDPVFLPDGYKNTFAEISLDKKNKISHRALAVKKLISYLIDNA